MEAIILAAGIGSRLAPITNEIPKSLVQVKFKPILQYQIESYLYAGINKINIVVGYKSEKIIDFINKNYEVNNCEINIIQNKDYSTTNNMYSLYLALKETNPESFILSNADVVIKKEMVRNILNFNCDSGIAYQPDNYNIESMKVSIDKSNIISKISKLIPVNEAKGTSIDFYKFNGAGKKLLVNEIFHTIEIKKDLNSWTEVAIDNILNSKEIEGINIGNEFWYEIDNHDDLENAEKGIE